MGSIIEDWIDHETSATVKLYRIAEFQTLTDEEIAKEIIDAYTPTPQQLMSGQSTGIYEFTTPVGLELLEKHEENRKKNLKRLTKIQEIVQTQVKRGRSKSPDETYIPTPIKKLRFDDEVAANPEKENLLDYVGVSPDDQQQFRERFTSALTRLNSIDTRDIAIKEIRCIEIAKLKSQLED
jgi:hypothetical protein